MTDKPKDTILLFGNIFVSILQGISALATGVVVLLVPVILLASQGMMSGLFDADALPIVAQAPLPGVSLMLLLAAICTALFFFFAKMRAIIRSIREGDPFIPANARRLQAMAWLLLGVEVLAVLVGAMRVYLANSVAGTADRMSFSIYDLSGLLMVVTLFILARVFTHGAAMRDDLEGTV